VSSFQFDCEERCTFSGSGGKRGESGHLSLQIHLIRGGREEGGGEKEGEGGSKGGLLFFGEAIQGGEKKRKKVKLFIYFQAQPGREKKKSHLNRAFSGKEREKEVSGRRPDRITTMREKKREGKKKDRRTNRPFWSLTVVGGGKGSDGWGSRRERKGKRGGKEKDYLHSHPAIGGEGGGKGVESPSYLFV